jgi:hypothetical protein
LQQEAAVALKFEAAPEQVVTADADEGHLLAERVFHE